MALDPIVLSQMGTIIVAYGLGAMSPGPGLAVTTRNSLFFSRRAGVLTAVGTCFASGMHSAYTLLGVGLLLQKSPQALIFIQLIGAAYLMYLSWHTWRAPVPVAKYEEPAAAPICNDWQAFTSGFLTASLNPMMIMFLLAVFSSVLQYQTPGYMKLMFLCLVMLIDLTWFSTVALCFSHKRVRNRFLNMGPWLNRVTGLVLGVLAIKIVLSATHLL